MRSVERSRKSASSSGSSTPTRAAFLAARASAGLLISVPRTRWPWRGEVDGLRADAAGAVEHRGRPVAEPASDDAIHGVALSRYRLLPRASVDQVVVLCEAVIELEHHDLTTIVIWVRSATHDAG
jgi:hypothetical protein